MNAACDAPQTNYTDAYLLRQSIMLACSTKSTDRGWNYYDCSLKTMVPGPPPEYEQKFPVVVVASESPAWRTKEAELILISPDESTSLAAWRAAGIAKTKQPFVGVLNTHYCPRDNWVETGSLGNCGCHRWLHRSLSQSIVGRMGYLPDGIQPFGPAHAEWARVRKGCATYIRRQRGLSNAKTSTGRHAIGALGTGFPQSAAAKWFLVCP